MENKETFNSIANEYEKYRPTYPNEMYNDILIIQIWIEKIKFWRLVAGQAKPREEWSKEITNKLPVLNMVTDWPSSLQRNLNPMKRSR